MLAFCVCVCERGICMYLCNSSGEILNTWGLCDCIFESRALLWTRLLSLVLLLIEAQRAFLGCESEDRGHQHCSKLALKLSLNLGPCLHTYIKTHKAPLQSPWKKTSHLYEHFHLTQSKPCAVYSLLGLGISSKSQTQWLCSTSLFLGKVRRRM